MRGTRDQAGIAAGLEKARDGNLKEAILSNEVPMDTDSQVHA